MGRLIIFEHHELRRGLLLPSTLLGRHWRCDIRLASTFIPLHWLEVRWLGTRWGWRCLGADSQTTGRGGHLVGGWRSLELGQAVRLESANVKIELIDDTPPGIVLSDVQGNTWIDGDERFEYILLHPNGPMRLTETGSSDEPILADGDLFWSQDRLWRLHRPAVDMTTQHSRLDLNANHLHIDFQLPTLTATFSTKTHEASISGVAVLALAIYVGARNVQGWRADGGWLSNRAACFLLNTHFNGEAKNPERLNKERARIRSIMMEKGFKGTDTMFERLRVGGTWYHRFAPHATITGLNAGQLDPIREEIMQ